MHSRNAMHRPRVLLLSYMVSPQRGSEYAVAWNYIKTMRHHCDLTVLYGTAGPHMGDLNDFAEPSFEDRQDDSTVRFVFVAPPRVARMLNVLNRNGILTYSFYLAYRVWHRAALAEAKRLLASQDFDIVHYLGPIGYREPGYLWRLPLPYIWGPIGGATSFPWNFRVTMPLKGRLRLMARTFGNALQLRFSRRVGRALRRADVLMTTTTENQAIFERRKGVKSIYLPENGIDGPITLNIEKFPPTPLRIAWIGSIEARKGLLLLIDALSRMRRSADIRVDIFGDGPLRERLKERARVLGVNACLRWHGHVNRQRVLAGLDEAHLHVLTGLNESNTTSLWEALGRSVPVLALDHCGMRDVVRPPYGLRVPVTSVDITIQALADSLDELVESPQQLENMARSCRTACDRYRIVHRPAVFLDAYRTAIARFQSRAKRS